MTRVGFAGLGWAAREFHYEPISKFEDVEVVGGFDLSAEQRDTWTAATGKPAYESFEALRDQGRPELLIVATPPGSHAELCIAAVEAGMHVFCEKPFVMNVAEADRVIAAAEAAGRHVSVNHEFREKPVFRAVRDNIATPDSGRLVFLQLWQLMDLAPWDEPVPWRAAMPDRALFEGGVHLVDLMVMIAGRLPTAVYARRSSGLDESRQADAIHLVTVEFGGGLLAQITIDRLCPAGTRYLEVRADCERASLRASLGGRATVQLGRKRAERTGVRIDFGAGGIAWSERGLDRTTLARNPRNPGQHATGVLLRRILDALARGAEPPSSARDARDILAIIDAAYRSSATGERVELDFDRAGELSA